MRFTYTYKTPLSFITTEDVYASSRVDAERKFWQRHRVDTCDVMKVDVSLEQDSADAAGNDPLADEQKAKAFFVAQMNRALIVYGQGRYSHLEHEPLTYIVEGSEEYVACGQRRACVTGDSLIALMRDIVEQLNWW